MTATGMRLITIAAITLAITGSAFAQADQGRVVKTVVPFAAGGAVDTLARVLSDQIGRAEKATLVVEHRPGAGTAIGTEVVSRAAPDGAALLMTANSFVINQHLKKLTYDPLTSFEPICLLARSPHLVVVGESSAFRTLGDLLQAAQARPGQITMAANGPTTSHHLAFEMLKRATRADMTFVPYGGNAPAVQAVLGNHVSSALADLADVLEHVKAGKLRALATGSAQRLTALPDVPTIAEAGFGGFESEGTLGIVAPAGTPAQTIARLGEWFTAALRAPEVQSRLASLGLYPVGRCGSDYRDTLRKQSDDYAAVIRAANIATP